MQLIKQIKQSSRGKGKGFAWQIELNLPSASGSIDAREFAIGATYEIVQNIRSNWRGGRKVDGSAAVWNNDTRERRRAERYVYLENPAHDEYIAWIADNIGRPSGLAGRVQNKKRRLLYIRYDNFDHWKDTIRKKYESKGRDTIGPTIGGDTYKSRYQPNPTSSTPLNNSGLMIDNLHGKPRKARVVTINGKQVTVNQHIEIRVPQSRQRTAAWVGGLTQSKIDRKLSTRAAIPETARDMDRAIRWDQPESKLLENSIFAARLAFKILRYLA